MMRNDLRTPAAIDLITRLGPTHTDEELVAELAAAGLTTGKKRPFDIKAVRRARYAYRVRAPRTLPFREGEIGIDDMARILGVSYSAAYYWITHHRLDARQDRSGRWCVTWNDEVEADCWKRPAPGPWVARCSAPPPRARQATPTGRCICCGRTCWCCGTPTTLSANFRQVIHCGAFTRVRPSAYRGFHSRSARRSPRSSQAR
ncbi:hypothetical protein [Streptomyces sp. TRM68416]|uniref:hypothetical protein n=1 Tax=Streptomyces sp. TRM68416 TaxID=2758412 RepID=UPI001661D417|nr:hypothetical protein [Streptomyces sp. TRM68416]MBD0843998.1 hypothetical protein [Streptomyces sp. TRM68416]